MDVTASMAGAVPGSVDIWDEVTNNLKTAIDRIEDAATDIMVITFTDCNHHHELLGGKVFKATDKDKKSLKEAIDDIVLVKDCHTDIFVPFEDFYNNDRIEPTKINYFFLMTDGTQTTNNNGVERLKNQIEYWTEKTQNSSDNIKYIYGFYVMLCNGAHSATIEEIVDTQNYLWTVKSADININLIRIEDKAAFNVRNDGNSIEIPIYGNTDNLTLNITTDSNHYKIDNIRIDGNKLHIELQPMSDIATLPEEETMEININSTDHGKFDFLLTKNISVSCLNKKERVLKINIK